MSIEPHFLARSVGSVGRHALFVFRLVRLGKRRAVAILALASASASSTCSSSISVFGVVMLLVVGSVLARWFAIVCLPAESKVIPAI